MMRRWRRISNGNNNEICKLRNNRVFREERFNINRVFVRVRSMTKEWELRNEVILGERDEGDRLSFFYKKKFYFVW